MVLCDEAFQGRVFGVMHDGMNAVFKLDLI